MTTDNLIDKQIIARFQEQAGFQPYDPQKLAYRRIFHGDNTVIAVGTGGGKTEAGLVAALDTGKRIIVMLPTKALLQDQLPRVQKLADGKRIVVDTGDEDDRSFYSADIILTNLDKFLYRMFAYGGRRYSYLYPFRIALSDDRNTLLILDEAHAYEDVAFSHFWFVLRKLTYEHRVQTVLLSATLPEGLVRALEDKTHRYFPRPSRERGFFNVVYDTEIRTGQVYYQGQLSVTRGIERVWEAYCAGERAIVVMRRVVAPQDELERRGDTLQEVWQMMVENAQNASRSQEIAHLENGRLQGSVLAYHGHQMPSYRRLVLERLKELDKAREPYLLLTTSAMEVGVDISATRMFTQLCEPDAFIQRIGRCARRKGEQGYVFILHDEDAHVPRGSGPLREYLEKLRAGQELDGAHKQAINELNRVPNLDQVPLRLEYQQDLALYRYVYDYVRENEALWQKGLIFSRNWEPSITLVLSEQRNGETFIGGIPEREFWHGKELKDHLSISLSQAANIAYRCAWVFEGYDDENDRLLRLAVGGERQRHLGEALHLAGYQRIWRDADQVTLYGMGLPLILLLGQDAQQGIYDSDNSGLSFVSQYARPTQRPPSPLLRTRQVELRKRKGKTSLSLYWFEPVAEEESDE